MNKQINYSMLNTHFTGMHKMSLVMFNHNIKKYLLVALLSYSCFGFSSVKTITITAQKYDKFIKKIGKGIYWDIMKNIFNKEGYNVIFELFLP